MVATLDIVMEKLNSGFFFKVLDDQCFLCYNGSGFEGLKSMSIFQTTKAEIIKKGYVRICCWDPSKTKEARPFIKKNIQRTLVALGREDIALNA